MSLENARRHLARFGKADSILEFPVSSATVHDAALALDTEDRRIAKTLSFRGAAEPSAAGFPCILVVAAGDARIDNRKFREHFGFKARMLNADEAIAATGHAVGGVCPFGVDNPLADIYLDVSLNRFTTVFPACGSGNSAIELTIDELERCSAAKGWVDVCKDWEGQ
ncbi:MAG: YbaK/EbsC family protein [Methylobacteriaceae bacterium]|jgi:prolyl-tRNA editing enzyme YbaK/EbsC (Cys-tRNA(Pro) deacylase)|nr:YbaK/EbsC family protein [Methylobacteriaceae bacterium]